MTLEKYCHTESYRKEAEKCFNFQKRNREMQLIYTMIRMLEAVFTPILANLKNYLDNDIDIQINWWRT